MKKVFVFSLIAILLLAVGVFAAQEVIPTASGGADVSPEVSGYVQDFAEKRGIDPASINNVTQVDFEALPKEVNIKNVNDNNLAIYQVDYDQQGKKNQVYVITYSTDKLKSQGDIILAQDKREFLNFGVSGTQVGSHFLETSTGVMTSEEKGYVMVRDGSITAISTNLEITQANTGNLEVVVYKNGVPISFGNTFVADTAGVKKDYDVQAQNTVTFNAGDVISVSVASPDGVVWADVTTMVEITTTN